MKKQIIPIAIFILLSISTLAQKVYNIKKYGAKGDGKTNDALAIQKAIDACSLTGGQVLVPAPFTFLAGPFNIKSNINLHIEGGAKILASPDEKLYTESAFRENKGEGTIWIGAKNIKNFSITGNGEIDGNGISFMGEEEEDAYILKPFNILDPRPHVLTIIGGENIRIKDIIIGNSAYWTIHLVDCNDVVISGITLLNSLKVRNSDGIDIDHSKNVRISDCYIESGDDCICLKNRREFEEFGPCENIVVTNCTMTSSSCAIKIGSENMDNIRQVVFDNCIIKNSNRGIGIQNRDEGTVSDIIFSNMIVESKLKTDTWWGKAEPIYVTAYSRENGNHKDANWRFPKGATQGRVGEIRNIYFTNIQCIGENGVYVSAETNDKIKNIVFEGVNVFIDKTSNLEGGIYDRRPSKYEGFIKGSTSGFYFDTAENIKVNNCSVNWGKNKQDYFKYAIESKKVTVLKVFNLDGESAFPDKYELVKNIQN